jgi:hypothetical protein
MSALGAGSWALLSPYLDEALEMTDEELDFGVLERPQSQ